MKIGFFGNKRRKSLKNKHMKFTSNLSQRDPSTSWIGPQSGYIPTGFVHFVDWSQREYFPNKKASHFCKALLPSLDSNQGPPD